LRSAACGRLSPEQVGRNSLLEVTLEVTIDGRLVELGMEVKAKGIEHPVTLYEALGVGRPHKLYLPERGETALSLTEAVPFRYEIVEANFSGRSLAGKQCPRAHSQPTHQLS
jgi:hypothetical protein